jgi:hypothetical protein
MLTSKENLDLQHWTIPLDQDGSNNGLQIETQNGTIFEIPRSTDYLCFGLDVFDYLSNHPEKRVPRLDWQGNPIPDDRPTQQDYVNQIYDDYPEIIDFYRYFNKLFDEHSQLKDKDIYEQLDYLELAVKPKYQPLIKYLRTQIILAAKNNGYDYSLSFRGRYNKEVWIENFCTLKLDNFNFSKVTFFRALNASFKRTFTHEYDGGYAIDPLDSEAQKKAAEKRHYNNYYKNLKIEFIVNPILHFSTLFHATNYNQPILANLYSSNEDTLNSIGHYYFDYEIFNSSSFDSAKPYYFKAVKNAKLHQLIYPEVYFILYTLMNFGFIGINYAIFKSRIKRNKF